MNLYIKAKIFIFLMFRSQKVTAGYAKIIGKGNNVAGFWFVDSPFPKIYSLLAYTYFFCKLCLRKFFFRS